MPIFENGDPMDNHEFRRQQRKLDAKLARKRKIRDDEIRALHKELYGNDKEENALDRALQESQDLYGDGDSEQEGEDDESNFAGSF